MNWTKVVNLIKHMYCDVLHKTEYVGLENIDKGKLYVIAANHVGTFDPAFIMNISDNVAIMAKKELFSKPIIKNIVVAGGAFPVDRASKDIKSVLHAANILTQHQKNLLIFPEGTRHARKKQVRAKNGAVGIAIAAGKEVLPVYLPEKRKLFGKCIVRIGKPINVIDANLSKPEITCKIMDEIYLMGKEDEKNG